MQRVKKNNPVTVDIPASAPRSEYSASSKFLASLGRKILGILGWEFIGSFPDHRKLVCIAAPHRSNWDWVIGVCFVWASRVKFSYLIKKSVMKWPLSVLVRRTGGIPIDRNSPIDVVDQVVNFFNQKDSLYFAITPEGTRKEVSRWKSGFLRIAYALEVPVIPIYLDYINKQVRILGPLDLDGEIDSDILKVQGYFEQLEKDSRN